jgi:predicted PolB exonuclease-like 3'-5' exonuclease
MTVAYAVFDIETRIDKSLVKAVYAPHDGAHENDVFERVRSKLMATQGNDFFPVSFHVPIAIVVGSVTSEWELISVEEVGGFDADEESMVRAFWERVEQFTGTLVSFNGRNFDLPVLELQALRYGCAAPRYFNEKYGHRYRYSEQGHYDLYEFLTNAGVHRLRGGFHLVARLIGLPGKGAVDGSQVQALWEANRRRDIVAYCRRDVIQTYLLFLRVELMRGRLSPEGYARASESAAAFRDELTVG